VEHPTIILLENYHHYISVQPLICHITNRGWHHHLYEKQLNTQIHKFNSINMRRTIGIKKLTEKESDLYQLLTI
jgi:hypothetical protein